MDLRELIDRFDNENARIERMGLLAGMLAQSGLPNDIQELVEGSTVEELEAVFGPIPDFVKEGIEEGADNAVEEWLLEEEKLGFIIEMATPVKTWRNDHSATFSWSQYYTQWVYGDTLEEALEKGFTWVEECRAKDKKKAGVS